MSCSTASTSRRSSKRRSRVSLKSLFLLLLILPVAAGCGLPTEPFLYPPDYINTNNPGVLQFRNDPGNNPDVFLGYMLFYKLYDFGATGAISADTLQTEGENYLSVFRLNQYSKSENGTGSIVLAGDRFTLLKVLPFDSADTNDAYLVNLDFQDLTNANGDHTATNTLPDTFTLNRRDQVDTGSWETNGFATSTEYDTGQSDVPSTLSVFSTAEVIIAVWAVAYGFDIYDTFQNVYSRAEYIGQYLYTIQ